MLGISSVEHRWFHAKGRYWSCGVRAETGIEAFNFPGTVPFGNSMRQFRGTNNQTAVFISTLIFEQDLSPNILFNLGTRGKPQHFVFGKPDKFVLGFESNEEADRSARTGICI